MKNEQVDDKEIVGIVITVHLNNLFENLNLNVLTTMYYEILKMFRTWK